MNSPSAIDYFAPPCVARFSAIFWEPVSGTGERLVALIAVEPDKRSVEALPVGTHVILPPDRLKAMFGRQRGISSHGVLKEVAAFMTACQLSGQSLEVLETPFVGFVVGPVMIARGYGMNQLLDAAVRTASAFGNADDMLDENEEVSAIRNTVKTAEFLKSLRRQVAGDDESLKARFEKRLQPKNGLPDLTVDYAFKQWLVQITSLPTTPRQTLHSIRESQSKLYELDLIRRDMDGNNVSPILLVNEDALFNNSNIQAMDHANLMLDRLKILAKSDGLELIQTKSPEDAAKVILALA